VTEPQRLPPHIPPKYASAAALIRDAADRLLIVNPTYKDGWELPGGIVEANESPRDGCIREVREEIGLDLPIGHMLVVDHGARMGPEGLHFVFDGGTLDESQIASIVLEADELSEFEFVPLDEATARLVPGSSARATHAVAALAEGRARYLETGVPKP
jgi:ADP-ribose pyrophosphatase YjhB (NUDIX family)